MKQWIFPILALASLSAARADVSVKSPAPGAEVTSPFMLSASASTCNGVRVVSMGYSFDNSSDTTILKNVTSINREIDGPAGKHVLHVKAWGQKVSCSEQFSLTIASAPATGPAIAVASPTENASVVTPFPLIAKATTCQGKTVTAMGYSIDNSSNTTIRKGQSLNELITSPTGSHKLRVKSWGPNGAACATVVDIKVSAGSATPPPPPPVTYQLTLQKAGTGSGTIVASPAGGSYAKGTKVTLAASPDAKSVFTGWSGACSGTGICTVTMTTDTSVTAVFNAAPPPPNGPAIPGNAVQVTLDPMNWSTTKDAGTPGTGCTQSLPCSTTYPVAVDSAHPLARRYSMNYTARAGVRWAVTAATDLNATHFIYDTWVYSDDWSQAANLEMDINQVTSAGKTRILGTQCSSYSHTWEYTFNKTGNTGWHWVATNVACDPTKWTAKTWKHIQIVGHFDSSDVSYYEGVWIDGQYFAFNNAQGESGRALGWAKGHIVINFQIDGTSKTTGSETIYANKLTIIRW